MGSDTSDELDASDASFFQLMSRTSLALLPNLVEGTLPTQVLPEFCPAAYAIHFCFVSNSLASFLLKPSRVGTKDAGYHQ